MVFQQSRRSFMAGMAVTASAGAFLPVAAMARNAAIASEGLSYRTAGDLVNALADRQISSRELLDATIARIEALDPKINAVVVRDFDRARKAADEADAALSRGERRPLLGLPMTVKEQFHIAGLPTTDGYPKFKDWKAEVDALAVQRLKSAGAVIIGKTNLPMGIKDWQSYNDVYGTTNNPWDLGRTPGGWSGGSAAALAAGFVSLELGSDIGIHPGAGAFLRRVRPQADVGSRTAAGRRAATDTCDPGAGRSIGAWTSSA
jgi:amidase